MNKNNRLYVIETTVFFEYQLSYFLSQLLYIDLDKSVCFGNSSQSLSFSQKILLLTDIKAIQKSDKEKFIKLSEIRNQFAHNKNVNTFSECYNYINGISNFLAKKYEVNNIMDSDSRNKKYFDLLIEDLYNILSNLRAKIIKKSVDNYKTLLNKELVVLFYSILKDTELNKEDIEGKIKEIEKKLMIDLTF